LEKYENESIAAILNKFSFQALWTHMHWETDEKNLIHNLKWSFGKPSWWMVLWWTLTWL